MIGFRRSRCDRKMRLCLWILALLCSFSASSALLQKETFMNPARPLVCVCPDDPAQPVCGIDGKTYSSKCMAACRNVEVKSKGPCWKRSFFASKFRKQDSNRATTTPRVRNRVRLI